VDRTRVDVAWWVSGEDVVSGEVEDSLRVIHKSWGGVAGGREVSDRDDAIIVVVRGDRVKFVSMRIDYGCRIVEEGTGVKRCQAGVSRGGVLDTALGGISSLTAVTGRSRSNVTPGSLAARVG
jgi:hypothetical protein